MITGVYQFAEKRCYGMGTPEEETERDNTKQSLERIQKFDVNSLPRVEELGKAFAFTPVVEPAQRLVDLFKRVPITILEDLPLGPLRQIKAQADAVYKQFSDILNFNAAVNNANAQRESFITQVTNTYESVFSVLHPFVSYAVYKLTDFDRLEQEARAVIQSVTDETNKQVGILANSQEEASKILDEIRSTAAEQGVTQQAIYFKNEADAHFNQAKTWFRGTVGAAVALGAFAIFSLFLHKIDYLKPTSIEETAQLIVSKVLIFSVIAYMLYLSAKNFLSHKHNSIINRHRQNALLTYQTIVDGAANSQIKDAVLLHASSCIYSPQNTGYAQDNAGQGQNVKSIVELMSKPMEAAVSKSGG